MQRENQIDVSDFYIVRKYLPDTYMFGHFRF
jgi:hypothetical protein